MAIVYRKEGTLRPIDNVLARRWFVHVQNDGDSIFVIISLNALVSIGCITGNQSVAFIRELCKLVILEWVVLDHWLQILGCLGGFRVDAASRVGH